MTQIIHCADLHLSMTEREYGLAVLDEILDLARGADALIMAGDLFDSFQDLESLRADFRKRVGTLPEHCKPIVIAGNHERLGGGESLAHLDLGCPVQEALPFGRIELPQVEILTLPYRTDYAGYLSWAVPPRTTPHRLAVAHGTVVGVSFAGPGDEEEQAAIDANVFARLGVEYAAMGHIHAGRIETVDDVVVAYSGSARVWRRGEQGPRGVISLAIDDGLSYQSVPLRSAGEFRLYRIPLDLDGGCPDLSKISERWGSQDWVEIDLTGLVENEHSAVQREGELQDRYGSQVRRFDVRRDSILVLDGIASQPVARRFLDLWRSHRPNGGGREREIWLQARELGLAKIKASLEARR